MMANRPSFYQMLKVMEDKTVICLNRKHKEREVSAIINCDKIPGRIFVAGGALFTQCL